jgi:hypothetical protein
LNTIERVISMLVEAGYRRQPMPLTVSKVPYEFAAALTGGERSLDLVIVVDLVLMDKNEPRLVQKLQSLSRALDLAESRRSVTAVLVGVAVSAETTEALGQVCRVLSVGLPPSDQEEQYLSDWLAVLLPLPDFDAANTVADWESEIDLRISKESRSKFIASAISASNQGAQNVEKAFATQVRNEAAKALRERSDD